MDQQQPKLSPEQLDQLRKTLNDPESLQKLLSSPQLQAVMQLLQKGKQ